MLTTLTRRELLQLGLAAGAASLIPSARLLAQGGPLIFRAIPSSGEKLPAVGIGTAGRSDVAADTTERIEIKEVIRLFSLMGGKVIDTAPSYGAAEAVVGESTASLGVRARLFLATKVGATG